MASAAPPGPSSTSSAYSSSDGEGGGEEEKEVQRGDDDDRDVLVAGLMSKHRALSQQERQQPQQQPGQPQANGAVAAGGGQWGSPQKSFTKVRLSSLSSDDDLEERAARARHHWEVARRALTPHTFEDEQARLQHQREHPDEPTSPGRDEGRKRVGSVLADFHAAEAARSARSARSPRDSGEHGGEQGRADHVHLAHVAYLPWSLKVRVASSSTPSATAHRIWEAQEEVRAASAPPCIRPAPTTTAHCWVLYVPHNAFVSHTRGRRFAVPGPARCPAQ